MTNSGNFTKLSTEYEGVPARKSGNPFVTGTLRFNGNLQPVATTESNSFTIQPSAPVGASLENNPYITPEGRTTLRLPKGWVVGGVLLEEKNNITIQFTTTDDSLKPLTIIYSGGIKNTAVNVDEETAIQVEGIRQQGAVDITKKPVMVSGASGYAIEADMDMYFGILTHVKILVLVKGNGYYLITGRAKQSVWNQQFPAISASMETIQI